jgi:hypothetical protein
LLNYIRLCGFWISGRSEEGVAQERTGIVWQTARGGGGQGGRRKTRIKTLPKSSFFFETIENYLNDKKNVVLPLYVCVQILANQLKEIFVVCITKELDQNTPLLFIFFFFNFFFFLLLSFFFFLMLLHILRMPTQESDYCLQEAQQQNYPYNGKKKKVRAEFFF